MLKQNDHSNIYPPVFLLCLKLLKKLFDCSDLLCNYMARTVGLTEQLVLHPVCLLTKGMGRATAPTLCMLVGVVPRSDWMSNSDQPCISDMSPGPVIFCSKSNNTISLTEKSKT